MIRLVLVALILVAGDSGTPPTYADLYRSFHHMQQTSACSNGACRDGLSCPVVDPDTSEEGRIGFVFQNTSFIVIDMKHDMFLIDSNKDQRIDALMVGEDIVPFSHLSSEIQQKVQMGFTEALTVASKCISRVLRDGAI